jgi:hypothetical protein
MTQQNVNAYDDYRSTYVASLDPYQIVFEDTDINLDPHGIIYLSIDPFNDELFYEVFLNGLSYEEGDDVEIIQIHLGVSGEKGPIVLSLCNEKKGKGHCREGP